MLSGALSSRADMQHHTHFRALYRAPSEQHAHKMGEAVAVLHCTAACLIQQALMYFLLCHGNMLMACSEAEDEYSKH